MPGEQLVIILLLLVPLPVSMYLMVYFGRRREPMDFPLALIAATAAIWSGGYAMELFFDGFFAKQLAEKFQYLGLVMGPTGWFLIGMQLQDNLAAASRKVYLVLLIVPVLTLGMVFTSDFHHFFWRTKELVEFNGLSLIENEYGAGFWLHAVYSYTLHLVGTGLALTAIVTSSKFYLRQGFTVIVALTLPWLTSMVYVFRLVDYPIDFSPFALVISSAIFMFAVTRYKFGDLVALTRERVLAEMHDAILVLDERLRVVDFNNPFVELFHGHPVEIGQEARALFDAHPKLMDFLRLQQDSADLIYTGFSNRVNRVSSELIDRGLGAPARLVILRDLSTEDHVRDALRLVIEGTSRDVGEDYFRSLTRTLALGLNTKYAVLAALDEDTDGKAKSLAFWTGTGFAQNTSYDLSGTPGELVLQKGLHTFPTGVAEQFPTDETLMAHNIQSYLGVPLYSHEGEPLGLLAVMDDKPFEAGELRESLLKIFSLRAGVEIERQRREHRIEVSEVTHRHIVEKSKEGVCITSGEGIVEFVNETMAALLGRTQGQLLGSRFRESFFVRQGLPAEFDMQENAEFEFSLTNSRDEVKIVTASIVVIQRDDSHVTRILYTFTDVTEARLLEDTNEGIEARLRHAQKLESLGVLVGGVAHDFNNLLMPILGYVDLIKQRTVDDTVVSDYLDRMQLAGGKLADLCNQMLSYSGKGHFTESVIDFNEQVLEMQNFVRASIPRNLSVHYQIEDQVPAIRADASQVNQVMMNLLINASESMSQKQSGSIRVSTGQKYLDGSQASSLHFGESITPGDYVYFEVQDEGVGISKEEQVRLFEPFYTTELTGPGLGMAVVYGIVKAHHGAVEIISEVGVGSTIRVYFPPTVDALSSADPEADAPSEELLQIEGKILIVDDEPYVRDLMHGMLETMGLDVIGAEDGAQGLEAFRLNQSDIRCCVLDLTMPGIGGAELMTHIREICSTVPIMLISGYSQQEIRNRGLDSPNVSFLQKPFSFKQFKSAIRDQLDV